MTLEETGDDCNSSWCLPPETFQSILPKVEGILRLVRKGLEEDPQDVTQEVQKATTSHGSASEDVEREQRKKEREARADEAWKRNQRLTERVGKEVSPFFFFVCIFFFRDSMGINGIQELGRSDEVFALRRNPSFCRSENFDLWVVPVC